MKNGNKGNTSALYVWNGMSAFLGMSFHTDPHFHNTLQLVVDIERAFLMKDAESKWTSYSAAAIKAGHTHQLDSNDSIQLFIYLDAETEIARKITDTYLSDASIKKLELPQLRTSGNNFFKKLLLQTNCDDLFNGCMAIINELIEPEQNRKMDERISSAIAFILQADLKQTKVADIAGKVNLSESRFRHLFKEQVGQSVQNFMLWTKVVDSLNLILKGNQVTETAHDCGFFDASHMNRSYRDMLGIVPSKINEFKDDLRVVACGKRTLFSLHTSIVDSKDYSTTIKNIKI